MLAELYVLSGRDAGKGLSAGLGPTIFMGRAATNHLRIRDPQASRVHCRVDVTSEGLTLHDNNSGNGTYVNGGRVTGSRRLDDGDEIRIGGTRLKVLIETEEDRERWARDPGSDRGEASGTGEDVRGPEPIRVAPRAGARPTPVGDSSPSTVEGWDDLEASGRRSVDDLQASGRRSADDLEASGRRRSGARPKRGLREVLPGYQLEARLGGHSRAGMAVYRALQRSLDRPVALKVLLAKGPTSKQDVARLVREARAVARLPHPHIVTIHDIVKRGTLNVIVMEYLAGGSLADRLEDGRLAVGDVLAVGDAVGQALAYAHTHGVVHRNVKPSNVLFAPQVEAFKLADFGFATDPSGQRGGDTCFLTTPLASFGYLAPEQLREDHEVDPRTDVYGLGATLFACASGRPPFTGDSIPVVAGGVLEDDPAPLEQVPEPLAILIARCLRKDPDERYPDGQALLHEVRACRAALDAPRGRR